MQYFLRFCSIISLIIFSIRLALLGNLSQGTIIFIIVAGLLILLGNRTIYIIASAAAALFLFIRLYGAGNAAAESALLQSLLTLGIVVFGLFVMLRGIFPASRNRRRYW